MKPKVIIDRDPISSEEILSRRNFRQLVTDAKLIQKPFFKSAWFISSVVVTLSAVATLLYFSNSGIPTEEVPLASENNQLAETTFRYAEDSPCIVPPIPGLEKKFSSVMIDPAKSTILHSPKGTDIIIPANSIVDLSGKPVTGKVEIRIRELQDIPGIMLSGIPMIYDSSGTKYSFSSAGMIQIYGYEDNKPVQLQDGKKIEIVLASRQNGNEYSFYTLDTSSGEWNYTGKENIRPVSSVVPAFTRKDDNRPTRFDSTLNRIEKEIKILRNDVVMLMKTKPEAPRKINPDKYNFDIDADPREFPELAKLAPARFEVGSENKNFTSENYDIVWDNVQLLENEKGKNYRIKLIKGKDTKEYIVYPVYEGQSYEAARKKFEVEFNGYNDRLKKKKEKEEEKEKELDLINKKRNDEIQRLNETLHAQGQSSNERKKQNATNNNEWLLRQYGLTQKDGAVYNFGAESFVSNSTVVTRTFQVDGFGTYNSDHPKAFPGKLQNPIAFYDKESGRRIDLQEAFLVVKEDNLYFRYLGSEISSLGFHPEKTNFLVAILPDGRVGIAGSKLFAGINRKESSIRIDLEISRDAVKDEEYFRSLLENN